MTFWPPHDTPTPVGGSSLRAVCDTARHRALSSASLKADTGTLARLAALRAEAPNAAAAIDLVERACLLSLHAGTPLRLPPLLLVGPPGTGKSRLATPSADQVHVVRQVIESLGLEVVSPDEARAILSLKGADQVAF